MSNVECSIIRDPRIAVEIAEGDTIIFAFGTREVLTEYWNPMKIPKSKDVEQIIALLENINVGVNIKYVGGEEEM